MVKKGDVFWASVLAAAAFVLAGCASTGAGTNPSAHDPNVYYEGNYWSWGWGGGVNSGGTSSISGWRFSDGKLRYEIREYGGRRR